jgi:hypothetical protein
VEISSIDDADDYLNNLLEISNRTENAIPSIINLAHKIHESDTQRPIYLTHVGPNTIDEWEQNVCDKGDDVRNEDNDVSKEDERNDDDEGDNDFVSISTDMKRLEKIIGTWLMEMMI